MPAPIGIISSGATESYAIVILYDGMEKKVENESLVLIKNKNGGKVLAVCRGGKGINDSLRTGSFTPGVAYAKSRRVPSSVKEYFLFNLQVIGEIVDDKGISQNRIIIAPTSQVEVFDEDDNPMQYLGRSELTIGHYWGRPSWKIPVLKEYINYHIGVFGVTGSGKSYLTRYEIIPLLRKAGYDVIIMDWKGSDYSPYFKSTITFDKIKIDNQTVIKYFGSITKNFGYYEREENPVAAAVETALRQVDWRGKDAHTSRNLVYQRARSIIMNAPGVKEDTKTLQLNRLDASFEQITEEEFERFLGTIEPWEIVTEVREKGVLVIDMSKGIKDQKLAVFTAIVKYLKRLMENKQVLNIALVIDEGPQYAPWQPRGMERETTDIIIDLCALGRSYGLSIIILSQGMAGEIGLNSAVRRNLNTQFIGRIHPLDVEEAQKLAASYYISPETLLTLPEGHFYFLGRMNPSPIPLLISFQIDSTRKDTV
ncbi:MAG: ATP-binding protein [Nitrososphaeria archaeon]|nr:ATP-binding protein [Nitrososphaeria archaeon]MDW7985622.1 ATP-binding protein [Nitrososphaerota archaeon]